MKRRLKWIVFAAAVLLLGALVARTVIARKSEQARIAKAAPSPMAIDLLPGDVVQAVATDLTRTLDVSGGLKAVRSALVKARVAAEVREIGVREGDTVRAGQLLGRLDDTEYRFRLRQAEQQQASAQAQLQIARRALENNRALVDQGFISKNALDTSISTAAGNEAGVLAAAAAADLARKALRDTEIRAPIAGMVAQRAVQVGERVSVDARLVEIVDLSQLELEAALAPENMAGVTIGAIASLQVDGVAAPASARLVRINPSTQAGTRAITAYLAVDPLPGLRQGLFARGSIEIERRRALAVPASAVRVDQARPYVLVVAGGQVANRLVTLGDRGNASFAAQAGEQAFEIKAGLAAGELVLRGTVGALRDGTAVRLTAPGGVSSAPAVAR